MNLESYIYVTGTYNAVLQKYYKAVYDDRENLNKRLCQVLEYLKNYIYDLRVVAYPKAVENDSEDDN